MGTPSLPFGDTSPALPQLLLCRALSVLVDDVPLCSQVGRGAEHGETEASSGSEHPETQPKGAGPAQPARLVTGIVQPSPEAALEMDHPPKGGQRHLQLTHRHLQRSLWEDAFSSMAKNSWQDNLTPASAIHFKSAALLKPLRLTPSSINSWRVFRVSGGCAYPETLIKPAL